MKFRWKLLLLLMSVSILPIIGLRTYGIHNVRLMAEALIQKLEQVQEPADSSRVVPPLIQGPDSGRTQSPQDQLTKDGVLELKQNILERVGRVENLTGDLPVYGRHSGNAQFTRRFVWQGTHM